MKSREKKEDWQQPSHLIGNTYIGYAYKEVSVDVGAVTLEVSMRLNLHLDHEVAGRAAQAGIALLGYA